jgi:nucleoside-diphosphate-sugar epimerase
MVNRVLVTGSSGMLGGNVAARFLTAGCEVIGLDLVPRDLPGLRQVTADVRDRKAIKAAMDGCDLVVHTAAGLPSYPLEQISSITVGGTANVLHCARACAVPRVVYISSTAVYGLPKLVPTPENHPHAPVDGYSRAKAEAENLAVAARQDGVVVPVLRPKTFIGPGRMGLFSMLFEWAEEGHNFPVLGRGDVRIQMLAIEDLTEAVWTVSVAPAALVDNEFNVAAEQFGTLREDFQAVLDEAGHGKRTVGIPAAPAVLALRALGRCGLSPVYDRLLHKLCADSYVSTDRIRAELGFRPRYSNREAILRTYRWWRDRPRISTLKTVGRTSRDPWKQGALRLTKAVF